MSPDYGVADVAYLRTTDDDVDYLFRSGLNGFVCLVIAVSEGILPLVDKAILEVTSLEKFGYL